MYHHDVEAASGDVGEEALEGRTTCDVIRGGPPRFVHVLARMPPASRRDEFVVLVALGIDGPAFVGGLMLITGLFTRLGALALAINMVFAIRLADSKQGLIGSASGYMHALATLGIMVGLVANGPGGCSVEGDRKRWLGILSRARRRRATA